MVVVEIDDDFLSLQSKKKRGQRKSRLSCRPSGVGKIEDVEMDISF